MNEMREGKAFLRVLAVIAVMAGVPCAVPLRAAAGPVELTDIEGARGVFLKKQVMVPRDLYKLAHEAFTANRLDEARLYALRIYFDGFRSTNLLDLLGGIEIKAGQPLLAGEWLRKALCLNQDDPTARKLLARLPPPPRPIPVDPSALQDHFGQITSRLPQLLNRLKTSKLHYDSVLDEIARGQFYKALALAEEYEKRYPGVDGGALTALCALYLGRIKDATLLCDQGLAKEPCHALLLFIRAMIVDVHPETSATSRARALYDLDRWKEAEESADQLTQTFSRSAEGLLVRARIALDRMQPRNAQVFLDQVAQRDPDHPMLDLLRLDLALMTGEPEKGSEILRRAFRRGYNLPSVNLKAGLLAAANARPDEAKTILDDAGNGLPFLDRDAWPLYVQLAIIGNRAKDARRALDLWAARLPRRSLACYMEALYWFKVGELDKGLDWLRKGFAMNGDHVTVLNALTAVPALSRDPALAQQIMTRLSNAEQAAQQNPALPQKIAPEQDESRPTPLPPDPTRSAEPGQEVPSAEPGTPPPASAEPAPAAAAPAPKPVIPAGAAGFVPPSFPMNGPAASSARFALKSADGTAPTLPGVIMQSLETTMNRLEPRLGNPKEPVTVHLVPVSAMGSAVARYYPDQDILAVSALYADIGAVRSWIATEYPDAGEETSVLLSQALPGHELARELTRALLHRRAPKAFEPENQGLWLQAGVAEILGGSDDVVKHLLQSVQARIASDEAQLVTLEKVDGILADPAATIAARDTARAQAYLMAAFLVKKKADFPSGIASAIQLFERLGAGKKLDAAIPDVFQMQRAQFDSGWKESAFWSLRQGVPYEW
ncbi:MAG TPA: hypothetical protein PLP29_00555 [Candidatus Ozemobacteraceae bacterium]|nr:hypothetical protein [Candidatus Ozemobacteraceae bacterium]